ncbi:hemolysin activation protein [Actinoplanes cyaneus]|uniref:Hemolysin activation protein n=1 Tax=Actinoplanes cyaneus TaxID=52696 RepID=A0A919ICP1_9ACTN|nr:YggT family protein [Actinoplanes cyaneus]MCW2135641.1 YggT family protein [Actinoplanes cyaneus]GID62997.1 hemolysin activation protein [Actinoplanes cyaneus]
MGLLGILDLALLIVQFLLIARAVLDWSVVLAGPAMPGSIRSRVSGGVFAVTEPILAPVRRLVPPLRAGGMSIDLSFILVFFAVVILRSFI